MTNHRRPCVHGLYLSLIALLAPFVVLWLHRPWRGGANARRWRERFGDVPAVSGGLELWLHAASVGEVQAASPLIDALLARHGDGRLAVTTMTSTGSDLVRQRWGTRVVHAYVPLDLPHCVRRVLARWQPRRAIVMESELWPTLFRELARCDIPLLLANARMSPRSQRRYRRLGRFVRGTVGYAAAVAAQSTHDAQSYRALGAARVEVTGNLKFDCGVPQAQVTAGEHLRAMFGAERPVWLAASTHDGEELAALTAHRRLLQLLPDAVLIVVPRHPQRFEAVWQLLRQSGLAVARRSGPAPDQAAQLILGDSMGEMFAYLAACDVAFVGGSLVPVGGHNILEPAALGRPLLFGPHMHNQLPARSLLIDAGAAIEVDGAAGLGEAITRLLRDRDDARRRGLAGLEAIKAHQGATSRVLALYDSIG